MSDPGDFGTFGRYQETSLAEMPAEMREAYDTTMRLRGQVPGPHKIWLSNPALSNTIVPVGAYYQERSTLTKAEIEIATNVVNGRWLTAYSNYEHEMIAEEAGGLPAQKVEALIAGLPTGFDDPRQQVVYELACALVTPRVVPVGLFRRAHALLGDAGIVDVTMLLGWFTGVCLTLAAFDVPSNAVGLKQPQGGAPQARLNTVALFPTESFLENLAVRSDNSMLVTSMNTRELFYVAPASGAALVEPVLLHRFEQPATGVVEIEPDLFLVSTSNVYTSHESYLHRVDLRDWQPGSPVQPELVFHFPDTARGLNGSCLLAPGIVLIADCFAGLIWRVDVSPGGTGLQARIWLAHDSMGYFPGKLKPEQPGVNGVRYAARTHHLYYTSTAKKLLMRVPVDPATFDPAGPPELVLAGRMGDDFCIDENSGAIYLATHRQNTIDRISMDPGENSGFTQSVAGDPFTEALIGPCSVAWSRAPGEYGKVAFIISDGGTASPPPGGPRPAKLQRLHL